LLYTVINRCRGKKFQ